jgi:hypothetical protein
MDITGLRLSRVLFGCGLGSAGETVAGAWVFGAVSDLP